MDLSKSYSGDWQPRGARLPLPSMSTFCQPLVIANHYLVRYLTPPADPEQLIRAGIVSGKTIDRNENRRVLDYEPLRVCPLSARVRACFFELMPGMIN